MDKNKNQNNEVLQQEQEQEQSKNYNNQKNTNLFLDVIVKTARIQSLAYNLLDFNSASNFNEMILSKEEYENMDKAITTIAELFHKRHTTLLTNYLNKKEGE